MDGPSHVSSLGMLVKVRSNVSAPGNTNEISVYDTEAKDENLRI